MKNISIRKAIGVCYLGVSIVFTPVLLSINKSLDTLFLDKYTPLFIIGIIFIILSLLSSALWITTYSNLTKKLGYVISFLLFLAQAQAAIIFPNSFNTPLIYFSFLFFSLTPMAFLSLLSYSPITLADKNHKIIDTLDSEMLKNDKKEVNDISYFWTVNRIYSTTIFVFSTVFFLAFIESFFTKVKDSGIDYYSLSFFIFGYSMSLLFFKKPRWAKVIFVIIACIVLILILVLFAGNFFIKSELDNENIVALIGVSILIISLILILLSKEAKMEFER